MLSTVQDRTCNPKSSNSLPSCTILMSIDQRSLNMSIEEHVCEFCKDIFIPKYRCNPNRFCSTQCYWDSKKETIVRVCAECGVEYRTNQSGPKRCCSRECHYKLIGKNSVDTPCGTCGEIVHKWKSSIHESGNVYCSRGCSAKAAQKPGWREKYNSTLKYRLNQRIRGGIRKSIKAGKGGRRWEELVGFTLKQLEKHIAKQFKDGMSWDKFFSGEIHIDHKIPIAAHNFNTPDDEDFKRCWKLSNLQPLWALENKKKQAKIDKPFQQSLIFGQLNKDL